MTDFLHDHSLNHLSVTEARLSATLAQPKRIAFGCIAALTALGWLALGLMSAGSPLNWQALCQPSALGGFGELALTAPMWMAMTLAMMLPTAGPMILTYAEIADTAARKREPVASPIILTAGYVGCGSALRLRRRRCNGCWREGVYSTAAAPGAWWAARSFSALVSINSRR